MSGYIGKGTPVAVEDGSVEIDDLSATGTPSSTTFLRGDNSWQVVNSTPSITDGGNANAITINSDESVDFANDIAVTGNVNLASDNPQVELHDTGSGGTIWRIANGPDGNGKLTFNDNDTERVTFTNDGKVGIGTSSPNYKLEVSGDAQVVGDLRVVSAFPRIYLTDTDTNSDFSLINYNGTFTIFDDTNNERRLNIDSDGNVGIGTTPRTENKLQLADNSGGLEFSIDNGVSNTCRIFAYDRVGGAYNDLQLRAENTTFLSQGVEKARISSNGITFNGDTAADNALDDYEEGTWTPTMYFGGSTTGVTYTAQGGSYTKVGRHVTLNGYINLSNNGTGTGSATIRGLPYDIGNTIPTTAYQSSGTVGYWAGYSSTTTQALKLIGARNSEIIYIFRNDNDASNETHVTNSFQARFTFTYFTA